MTCPYDGREMRLTIVDSVHNIEEYKCPLCGYTYTKGIKETETETAIEYACNLQKDLDEYKRFCGDLLVSMINREHRMFIKHELLNNDPGYFDAIWRQYDAMLDEIAKLKNGFGTEIAEEERK